MARKHTLCAFNSSVLKYEYFIYSLEVSDMSTVFSFFFKSFPPITIALQFLPGHANRSPFLTSYPFKWLVLLIALSPINADHGKGVVPSIEVCATYQLHHQRKVPLCPKIVTKYPWLFRKLWCFMSGAPVHAVLFDWLNLVQVLYRWPLLLWI